ncbi:MAG: NADH-quinone oxidoreductase subunit NuoK [Deltaproteobacteria bacterium]|nr:NADH-quinone oxidoreductase subunit NuoK [Deltaproteobacteria bacterium]
MYPTWGLMLSGVIFSIGVLGVLYRRNILVVLMSLELMFNAANIALVALSRELHSLDPQIMVLFIMTVAAAEAAIGLSIVVAIFRNLKTVHVDELNQMQG